MKIRRFRKKDIFLSPSLREIPVLKICSIDYPPSSKKAISDGRIPRIQIDWRVMQLDPGAWKTSCEREVDRRERGSFPDDGMAFQSRRTIYFFFVPGIPMKNRERNDDRCARWYTEERTVEKRGNPCACIYIYVYIFCIYSWCVIGSKRSDRSTSR